MVEQSQNRTREAPFAQDSDGKLLFYCAILSAAQARRRGSFRRQESLAFTENAPANLARV
jgi:hypothetical protein